MSKTVKGKVAIVTGSISGMGYRTSELLSEEGAYVIATGLDMEILKELQADLQARNLVCDVMELDVTKEEQWRAVIKFVLDKYNRIDILANIAGVSSREKVEDGDRDIWNQIMDINAYGTYLGMKHCIVDMKKHGGAIVNISSVAGQIGIGGGTVYPASKGAVRAMSKRVAVDYGKENVRVNTIFPGWILTPMTENAREAKRKIFLDRQCLKYFGTPDDIAQAVLFLVSDKAKFITGAELVIDGGFTAS